MSVKPPYEVMNLTSKQKKELKGILSGITKEAKKVVEDYKKNP